MIFELEPDTWKKDYSLPYRFQDDYIIVKFDKADPALAKMKNSFELNQTPLAEEFDPSSAIVEFKEFSFRISGGPVLCAALRSSKMSDWRNVVLCHIISWLHNQPNEFWKLLRHIDGLAEHRGQKQGEEGAKASFRYALGIPSLEEIISEVEHRLN